MPTEFINFRIHDTDLNPGLSGLCVGYERRSWRDDQLVDHIMEWLPEFALSNLQNEKINATNAIQYIRQAAKNIYSSEKFKSRGEFGEILLHIAMRQGFHSIPAISKIYYKTADNDTVKGFDAVHVVENDDELELWLGEVKFYKDINSAIRDVVEELELHTESNYLRREFSLITNKIDDEWKHSEKLKLLLDNNRSLDEIFNRACLPVLLTYDSSTVNEYDSVSEEYIEEFINEIERNYIKFSSKKLPNEIDIHLILMPLKSKEELVQKLDEKLKVWQAL